MSAHPARRRGFLAAALVLLFHPGVIVANGDPATFVRVAKREISGKTGDPVKSVEVFHEGQAWLKDGRGTTLASARLSTAEIAAFHRLLADPAVLVATPECGPPLGADLPSAELVVQQPSRTVIVKVERHCRLPAGLDRLRAMLDDVERKYFSRR
ncbi:MAG: hypothetical protein HYR51_11410 [Candidatus Rokubacteria bacterium]|nr:hypothetical protein [Candidatus Rokubacteria bacterium]